MKKELTDFERGIIEERKTEAPFTGEYVNNHRDGTYYCRKCGAPLYRSADKFDSACGWPSFDDEIEGAVARKPDADGVRVEIVCAACGAHLGHVFNGEGYTLKNIRHCVNSASIDFEREKSGEGVPEGGVLANAIFAGGCFWGVEHLMRKVKGVVSVTSGYTGGQLRNPSYQQVKSGETGHVEAVWIVYDPSEVEYRTLLRHFFEIHDFTQTDGQGPDIGSQYLSKVFWAGEEQRVVAEQTIAELEAMGYKVATELRPAVRFWRAEEYHQKYFIKKNQEETECHFHKPINW